MARKALAVACTTRLLVCGSSLSQLHPVEAAVVPQPDRAGGKRLVAFWVAEHGAGENSNEPDDDQLQRHLREHVPEYMIPAAFQRLSALPLTPSGKVDRKTLGAQVVGQSSAERPFEAADRIAAALDVRVVGREQVEVLVRLVDQLAHLLEYERGERQLLGDLLRRRARPARRFSVRLGCVLAA